MRKGYLFFVTIVFALFFFAAFIAVPVTAAEWLPSDAVIAHGFGYNYRGRPLLGVFVATDNQVSAFREGEVIFSRSQRNTASRLPSPFGAWTAVDHGDGLLSIFSRHGEGEEPPQFIRQGDVVARAGVSGWSQRSGFYFVSYDRKERRWVNPAMVIPFPGTRPFQIQRIQLRNTQGELFEGNQLLNLRQGRYTVMVTAVHFPGGGRFTPFRVRSLVNGVEAGMFLMETIHAADGALIVNRGSPVSALQVYALYPAFEVADIFLTHGQAILEIIVQDIEGNSRNTSIRIHVD